MVLGLLIAGIAVVLSATAVYFAEEAFGSDFGEDPVGATEESCPPTEPLEGVARIVRVAFLDGGDATELAGVGKHFVNLPRDAKWVDGTHVTNIDRLSQKTRLKVCFDVGGSHNFKVKYDPDIDNVGYSDEEKGRNTNFKYQDQEKSYTTEADGTKIISTDFFVTAAGKDKYKLAAKDDNDVEMNSQTIEAHRLVYFQEIKMATVDAAADLNTVVSEYAKHNITLVALARVNMEDMENIGTSEPNNSAAFMTKARTAYEGSNASDKAPYVVAIGYTKHLAVKDASQVVVKSDVDVGPGKPDVEIPIVNLSGTSKFLWKNIVTGEGWFVSAKFMKDEGTLGSDEVDIPEADCTAVASLTYGEDFLDKVKVKVSGLAEETGSITLTVNWVNRMRGGLSFTDGNLVCVCTRAWWRRVSPASQNQTVVHELGHKVGMVADGTGTGPDKTAKHYTGKGHVGPHCHQGLPVQASYSGATGTCVIFGATHPGTEFCVACAPAVRKQDLSDGWSAF